MEPLFEVKYFCNRHMLAEYHRKYGVGPRWFTVCICLLLMLCILGQVIVYNIFWEMLPYIVFVLLVDLLIYFMPEYVAWAGLRNTKKQNDGVLPQTMVTFGDTIEMNEGMVHISIEYRKIIRTVRLKHSYLLMIGKRNGVMIEQDCFTKGSFEEFKQFLREKCPGLTVVE